MKTIRRQYRNYKVRIKLTEDKTYFYGLIYRPNGKYLCGTGTRCDTESVMAQAEETIDQDIRTQNPPNEILKITLGFVTQVWNVKKGCYVSQNFTAGDEVCYELRNGEAATAPKNESYLPFDMVQPKQI